MAIPTGCLMAQLQRAACMRLPAELADYRQNTQSPQPNYHAQVWPASLPGAVARFPFEASDQSGRQTPRKRACRCGRYRGSKQGWQQYVLYQQSNSRVPCMPQTSSRPLLRRSARSHLRDAIADGIRIANCRADTLRYQVATKRTDIGPVKGLPQLDQHLFIEHLLQPAHLKLLCCSTQPQPNAAQRSFTSPLSPEEVRSPPNLLCTRIIIP